jgi:hypothetical protein
MGEACCSFHFPNVRFYGSTPGGVPESRPPMGSTYFIEELRRLLEEYGVEYDPKYLE